MLSQIRPSINRFGRTISGPEWAAKCLRVLPFTRCPWSRMAPYSGYSSPLPAVADEKGKEEGCPATKDLKSLEDDSKREGERCGRYRVATVMCEIHCYER
jgi:hypothetical protein